MWLEPRDPRLLQLGFSLLFLLDMVLRVVGDVELRTGPLIGLVLVPVVWVVTLLVPWTRTPEWCQLALLVLDVGLVGLSRLDPLGGSALLVVVPALWLGFAHGIRGVVIAGVSTVLLVMVPGLFYIGATGINLSRSVTTTVIAVIAALVIANVIQRVRGSQELIELQRRVGEAILDTVDVGLVLLDGNGRYLTINRRHHDFMLLAFPAGHSGQAGQLGDVFHEDGETFVQHEDMPTYRATQGEEFDDQLIWVGSDPLTRRALSVSSRVVREESGKFAGAALAYKDVTDFMRALEVKEEFVASVSHELRTPLTSIHGFNSLVLERDDLPEEVRHQLGVVQRNVGRLDRLVSDLLQTAQVERGLVHLERERTDIAALVRQSLEAARPAVEAAGLTLESRVPTQLIVMVDPQRFAQVVDNLLSNAVKYTPSGGRIEVDLSVTHDRMELVVLDTGIGISVRDRNHVFSRFFRTRHAAQRSIQGIGLGLSISKAIVDSHGGRIEVESEEGLGSTFRVRLPLDVPMDQDLPAHEPVAVF
ncbi:MAG: two-component system, OmpR family, phosphate regulon sensor histidine kinase PhoR [Nocardioidaceae bacterium]|nr:two-component system, OmpR family, phosphate regulon sensor histidine kinase PhoR [Nocardioidaceae bacterium]